MHWTSLLGVALPCLVAATSHKQISLSDLKWTVTNHDNVTIPAQFPSQAHLDLYREGKIEDPLFGFNDYNQLWVQRSNWTWQSGPVKGLDLHSKNTQTWLVFEGLDTFAQVKICGQQVANTDNMYLQYAFDVSNVLSKCPGSPTVSINFGSASKIVLDIAKGYGVGGQEFDNKIYMRKEQNDFGWDWSPSVGPAGPWRPAYFVQRSSLARDPVVVENTLIDIYRKGQLNNVPPDQSQPWVFNASIDYLGGALPKDARMSLTLKDSRGRTIKSTTLGGVYHNNMTITGSTTIDKNAVDLWWAAGMGPQTLYEATVTISSREWSRSVTATKRVGFRTIVLNLNPITPEQEAQGIAPGANWHFELNGKPFYAKGANLVPMDVFWPRVNSTKARELFELSINAHHNMLRVWSSGVYLSDDIYDMADELGLLLWSEFQFTDSAYPADTPFLEKYQAEAYYNVRRVNHHASLALWAGGNELESIYLSIFSTPEGKAEYEEIQLRLLPKCVYANTKSISYIPSSTYNGFTDLDFKSVMPQTPRFANTSGPDYIYGNTDLYNYDVTQAFNYSKLPVGRFATEFGSIALPSIHSWRDALPASELHVESDGVLHHNRHTPIFNPYNPQTSLQGVQEATGGVAEYYPRPQLPDRVANFSAWCWATQVYQADKYATEIAFYRRGSARRERQMGSLFWQLNDLWVAPTWAAIEPSGRPKVMYYATKDIYSPLIVWPYYEEDSDSMDIWIVSDRQEALSGTVDLKWIDWRGKALDIPALNKATKGNSRISLPFKVGAINGTQVFQYKNVTELFKQGDINNALLSLTVTAKNGDKHASWFHPGRLGQASIPDPGLGLKTVTSRHHYGSGGVVEFQVTATKAIASKVWLDHPSTVRGFLDQNGFWLNKGETRTVKFTVFDDFTRRGEWVDSVTVRSLWDSKQKSSKPFL